MKIIKDSGVSHWALSQIVTCEKCNTQFQAESENDFEATFTIKDKVWMKCPRCNHSQRVWKQWQEPPRRVYYGTVDAIINYLDGSEKK